MDGVNGNEVEAEVNLLAVLDEEEAVETGGLVGGRASSSGLAVSGESVAQVSENLQVIRDLRFVRLSGFGEHLDAHSVCGSGLEDNRRTLGSDRK